MKQIKWISLLLMLAMVITACATVQQLPSGGTGNETDHNTDGQETVEVDLPDNLTYVKGSVLTMIISPIGYARLFIGIGV